jgi:tripartite-type tricarboxylate transporter receptor subunit TctC
MGRPFLAPPSVPADRVEALRKAFMDTLNDKELIAEAEKAQLEINPVAGDKIQALVGEVYRTPKEVAAKAAELLDVNTRRR